MAEPTRANQNEPGHSREPSGGGAGRVHYALSLVALSGGYFLAGKAGLLLAVGNASVSAVWPATGIAIAALLLGGSRLWPAVFAGAFLVNLTTTWDPWSSAAIASGNTLEGLVGAYLAARFASGVFLMDRPETVLTFAVLSGFGASTVAATVGASSLFLAHLATPGTLPGVWLRWWLGDAIGAIEVAPLVLAFSRRITAPDPITATPTRLEGVAVGILTVAVALLVFARAPTTVLGGYPLVFLVIPPTIWAALRFGSFGAVSTVVTVSTIAILATVSGLGPFASLPSSVALLALRIFMGSLALTALLVAADGIQHRRLEGDLNHTRKELQRMLVERTAQLDAAKSLAKVGTWSYDLSSGKVVWSEEMYRILGYGEERFPVVLENAFQRLQARDLERLHEDLEDALSARDPVHHAFHERRLRLELPDGEQRTILSGLQFAGIEEGRATRLAGTIQDITERERIETELRRLQQLETPRSGERTELPIWMVPWAHRRSQGGSTGSGSTRKAVR